jgi:hypothetical protein
VAPAFGADLRETVREFFPSLIAAPLGQSDYRSVVFIARHEVEEVDHAKAARRQAAEHWNGQSRPAARRS